jgi:hypothetical protein
MQGKIQARNFNNNICSMKLRLAIPLVIGLALVLTAVIIAGYITQNAYAAVQAVVAVLQTEV